MIKTSFEKTQKIAKELKSHEEKITILDTLDMIKGRHFYVNRKFKGVQDFSKENAMHESVSKGICPYCLNQIDWDKLNELKIKHQKEIHSLNKELVDLSR